MNEELVITGGAIAPLDRLAQEVRIYSERMAESMFQLGRALTEAKPQVPHGQWKQWLFDNSGMSVRTAQQFMQAWDRFGKKQLLTSTEKSKIFKMLSLPEGTEEDFLRDNDIGTMTARAVEDAVKKVREEMQKQIDAEKQAAFDACMERTEAEKRLEAVAQEGRERMIAARAEVQCTQERLDDVFKSLNAARKENQALRRDAEEAEGALKEMQRDYDELQRQLLDAKSSAAKGDAERDVSGRITLEDVSSSIRTFLASMAELPLMAKRFSAMDNDEWTLWENQLYKVEDWAERTRKALTSGVDDK